MTRLICWKKRIGKIAVAPIAGPINVRCEGRCDGRFDLGQWVRFAQKIPSIVNDRPLEGPASATTATQACLLLRH
jgi:hypothetical protein